MINDLTLALREQAGEVCACCGTVLADQGQDGETICSECGGHVPAAGPEEDER